ncbi:LAME_0H17788g1_1 [Lachancea meyersii CBS 8951]|uniref:LAME_0H17788g1_1 n=1 Tax=Lachancea meyersii CBS 8951 TaxID=1266667 RepID=A0A1G4KIW3_9SACH|nr:LAME_0H17788g1_1 [Lachancea meyersii CBS 8951]
MEGLDDVSDHYDSSHFSSERLVETAKFLADAKSSLLEDLNVENIALSKAGNGADSEPYNPLQSISKGSRVRADRVRSYIHFFYHLMEEEVESGKDNLNGNGNGNGNGTSYKGVEGVYNPLQVIRNRKAKKKLHHQLRNEVTFLKPPILAIRDFSSVPDRDFPWFVDVSERSRDLSWRMSNWEHLRRADGKRWFPRDHIWRSRSTTATSRSSPGHFYKSNRSSEAHSTQLAPTAISTRPGSGWELPSISVESVDPIGTGQITRPWEKALGKNKLLSRPVFHSKSNSQQHILEDPGLSARKYASHEQLSYITPTGTSFHHRNASDVQIRSIKRPSNTETPSSSGDSNRASYEFLELQGPFKHAVQKNTISEFQCNELKYLVCTWNIMQHRQETLNILQTRKARRDAAIKIENPTEFCQPAEIAVGEYRNELVQALKKCDIWKSRLLNDYAIRVESLISSSDRVLSDINTTLTLRLKQLQEKMDRFGNLKRMNKEPMRIFLYRVLEVIIVLLFWMIWFCFTVLKSVKIVILTLYKIASWAAW